VRKDIPEDDPAGSKHVASATIEIQIKVAIGCLL
jgi:hypothetical protein